MQKNTASQKWYVFAFEGEGGTNPGDPVTGDAANITANIRIDGGAANAVDDTNPTELEDGYYVFDVTAAETNGDYLLIAPESSTANVLVIGLPGATWTTPANFPDTAISGTGVIDADAVAISGSTQAAADVESVFLGTGHTDDVDLSVRQFKAENDSAAAIDISTSGNNAAIEIAGGGTEPGLKIDGGATGSGVEISGGATSGVGLLVSSVSTSAAVHINPVDGRGISITAGLNPGIYVEGSNDAVSFNGGGSGAGLQLIGGAGSGSGLEATGGGASGRGIVAHSSFGPGFEATGSTGAFFEGNTGNTPGIQISSTGAAAGLVIQGGDTSGDAIALSVTSGNSISYDGNNLDNLFKSAAAIITGSATGTPTTTSMDTDLTGFLDDELINGTVYWTGGTANGQRAKITDYAATNGVITYAAIATAPAASDPFVVA